MAFPGLLINPPSVFADFHSLAVVTLIGRHKFDAAMAMPVVAGLIQSLAQTGLPGLRAWVEVGGIASSLCPKAFQPQPISI